MLENEYNKDIQKKKCNTKPNSLCPLWRESHQTAVII